MVIKLYTAPHCAYSLAAKRFFEARGVPYKEVDVTADEAAYREMVEKSHQSGVPVVEVGNHVFVGFDRRGFAEALQQYKTRGV